MSATWTCMMCGKLTDGHGGIDDAMDCMCDRCGVCGGLTWDGLCDCYDGEYGDDTGL